MEKEEPIVIESAYLNQHDLSVCTESANNPLYWTRLTIKNGAHLDKDRLLDAIVREVHPHLLLPALYQKDGKDSFFFFRNGKLIVKKLLDRGLNISLMDNDDNLTRYDLVLTLNCLTVEDEPYDINKNIADVVKKRSNVNQRTVDLRNLKNDPDFKHVYVSLNSPLLMTQVCSIVKKLFTNIHALLLSHNNLERLDILDHVRKNFDGVHTLDIRHNKITYSGFEKTAKYCTVKHLLISGNPLCNDYQSPGEMICEMKKMVRSLETLDNVDIDVIMENRVDLKVYLRNPRYSQLVDHFLHHYYTVLEKVPEKLIQTYHNQATLSISVLRFESTPFFSVAPFFLLCNRNLQSMSDVTKTYDNIFMGKIRIFEALKSFPKVLFDPYSFKVDVPVTAKGEVVVISSTGLFCVTDQLSEDNVYTFNRVCILAPMKNGLGEWLILNDMWTIMPSSQRISKKFVPLDQKPVKSDFAVMLNPQLKDKDILIKVVSDLTNMKSAWVEKYLSDSRWDLELTLLSFTDQFKANLIPSDAFNPYPKT